MFTGALKDRASEAQRSGARSMDTGGLLPHCLTQVPGVVPPGHPSSPTQNSGHSDPSGEPNWGSWGKGSPDTWGAPSL